jgi:hypothetical protein
MGGGDQWPGDSIDTARPRAGQYSRTVSKHSRRTRHARSLHRSRGRPFGESQPIEPEPERLLLDQIAAGALDAHLTAIADAINARLDLLETIDSAKALAMLNVGDRVRFNYRTRPQYLRGVESVVIELDPHSATVRVHHAIGRFGSGEIRRCSPLLWEESMSMLKELPERHPAGSRRQSGLIRHTARYCICVPTCRLWDRNRARRSAP